MDIDLLECKNEYGCVINSEDILDECLDAYMEEEDEE
jgi:hypothetical protein